MRHLRQARRALAALLCSGCSLLVHPDPYQCASTADCTARGPSFAGTICGAARSCERQCDTRAECTRAAGTPALCRADHTCAALLSEDCTTLLTADADAANDAVIWFGVLLPLVGANASISNSNRNAIDLARRDFAIAVEGLPPAQAGGPRRPLGFVVCNDSIDARRAALHLTDDVRVPAIVGPALSGTLIDVAVNVTLPKGVLIVSGSATSPFITDLAGKNGLVWRTAPPDTVQASAIALLLAQKTEPELRAGVLGAAGTMRLAVVHKGDAYGAGIADALFARVRYNGKSVAENAHDYLEVDYGDGTDPTLMASAVSAVLAFAPHVVIVAGVAEAVGGIFGPMEKDWPAEIAYRPRYLLTDGVLAPDLLPLVDTSGELRHRILGTIPGTNSALYARFQSHYRSLVQDGSVAEQSSAANYDAAYLLAYAAAAAGPIPLTGASIGAGLSRTVPPGVPIDVGPEPIGDAFTALASGKNVDFNGAAGPEDFDPATGEAEGDIQIWCIDEQGGKASGFVNSGLFYNARSKALEGSASCP